jgi:hypothetical protein
MSDKLLNVDSIVGHRTSLADLANMGDPVRTYSFDVYLGEDRPSTEVVAVSIDEHFRIKFVITEQQKYPDLSYRQAKVIIYQKVGDNPKTIGLVYNLNKLVTVRTRLDGSEGNVPAMLEQVYEYTFIRTV